MRRENYLPTLKCAAQKISSFSIFISLPFFIYILYGKKYMFKEEIVKGKWGKITLQCKKNHLELNENLLLKWNANIL